MNIVQSFSDPDLADPYSRDNYCRTARRLSAPAAHKEKQNAYRSQQT
jgi:hypothetical protein